MKQTKGFDALTDYGGFNPGYGSASMDKYNAFMRQAAKVQGYALPVGTKPYHDGPRAEEYLPNLLREIAESDPKYGPIWAKALAEGIGKSYGALGRMYNGAKHDCPGCTCDGVTRGKMQYMQGGLESKISYNKTSTKSSASRAK